MKEPKSYLKKLPKLKSNERYEYRGKGWRPKKKVRYVSAVNKACGIIWHDYPSGSRDCHYWEVVKVPAAKKVTAPAKPLTPSQAYTKLQDEFIKTHNLKVGDYVKIVGKATDSQMGWDNLWVHEMDTPKHGKIASIDGRLGIDVDVGKRKWCYPFFVLMPDPNPPKPLPAPIALTNGYEVKFQADGSIKVGCQHITLAKLQTIVATAEKAAAGK